MSSPFVTVRYPDGAWEVTDAEKVPKVGETLRRSDGRWIVATAVLDTNGHLIVTWRRAPGHTSWDDASIVPIRP
jgi:hypothetical protein